MIPDFSVLHDLPSQVWLYQTDKPAHIACQRQNNQWHGGDVTVTISPNPSATAIQIHAPKSEISRVAIRWSVAFPKSTLFIGDAWERGYGELQWRHTQPDRILPWYFAAHDPVSNTTVAGGVKTAPAAMCFWMIDPNGITLWLDLRNGGSPSMPGDRVLNAASIVTSSGESPTETIRTLCKKMCEKPKLATAPICGSNNWYYAYGENFDSNQVKRDATLLAELAGDHANRPYCVIDAGWTAGGACPGGPWTAGLPDKFPDMPGLAQEIEKLGVHPGIWIRPTALTTVSDPRLLRKGPQNSPEKALDLTLPENLEVIRADIRRMHEWGYKLIKHDFSTFDALGRWGFEMGAELTDPGWHFADRSQTNAEILLKLYQTLREGAGDAILLGCNTVGHLGAGIFEVQRAGDDTSGRIWERTRKMGINTLAFRLPQNGTFFSVDADCVAHTQNTPWEKDRQWLDAVARSGTALFVSVDPTTITPEVKSAMTTAMQLALSGGSKNAEPLDWLTNTAPQQWRFDGQEVQYDWNQPTGAWPLKC